MNSVDNTKLPWWLSDWLPSGLKNSVELTKKQQVIDTTNWPCPLIHYSEYKKLQDKIHLLKTPTGE